MRLGRNVALTVLSCMIALVILEVGSRLLMPQHDPSGRLLFYSDSEADFARGKKKSVIRHKNPTGDFDVEVAFNENGFRDRKELSSADSDLILVGDSFGMGWGVEEHERFSNIAEERINRDIFNVSMPTDIAGYQKLLSFAQKRGSFDKLIVSVCMENDLANYNTGEQSFSNSRTLLTPIKSFLVKRSTFYNALAAGVRDSEVLHDLGVKLHLIDSSLDELNQNQYSAEVIDSSRTELTELIVEGGFRNEDTFVLIIPSRALWIGDHKDTEAKVHAEFVSKISSIGFHVLDMRPVLDREKKPMDYFFDNDGHWNARGHELAATELARLIG